MENRGNLFDALKYYRDFHKLTKLPALLFAGHFFIWRYFNIGPTFSLMLISVSEYLYNIKPFHATDLFLYPLKT